MVALLVALAWLVVATSVAAWASIRARARARAVRERARSALVIPTLGVCIVRPCAGSDPWLRKCLASYPRTRASRPPRIVFAVESPGDDAAPSALAAEDDLCARGIDASIVWTAARGPNHKAHQLARALERDARLHARVEIVVVADADVDLTDFDLDALVDPFAEDPRVGATWAPPVEIERPHTLGDRVSQAVLGGSLHAFPLLAELDPAGMVGKLFAVRASALADAGGFDALRHHLGEDMELSRRLRALEYRVSVAPVIAQSRASGRSVGATTSRYARWLAVIRAQRTTLLPSYPLLFAFTPGVLVLAVLGARDAPWLALGLAGAAIASRVSTAYIAAKLTGRGGSLARASLEALLADLVLLAAFVRMLSVRGVRWRGHVLRTDHAGRLAEVER